uniref:ATP-dependent RNA helicase n=1 Tax=Aceria tosichella TaxID=561515 RepID=A0A6G1SHQ1_9ACAR
MASSSRGWNKFSESPLNPWLKKHLASVNIERPSPIQLQLIQAIMSPDGKRIRRNIFGCSPTGTGKTLSYVLPVLHFLTQDIRPYFALILAPTRELAYQIYQIITILTGSTSKDGSSTMIKTLLLIGGGKTGLPSNETELMGFWSGKPNIVVATPGKLAEQLTRKNFSDHTGHRSALRFDFLILDEADLLIGPTFANQLKTILDAIDEHGSGKTRQTLVLSATLTSALEQLQKIFSSDDEDSKPVTINLLPTIDEVKQQVSSNPNLDQRYIICPEAMKPAYLVQALSDIPFKQTIIFCSSTRQAVLLHKLMINLGFDEAEVSCHPVLLVGSKDQKGRLKSLEKFKSVKSRVMIATGGLAGRGLDLPQVDLVVQYNCPTNPVDYIHRVGRTCRKIDFEAGKTRTPIAASKYYGKSILFITQYDVDLLKTIENFVNIRLTEENQIDINNITNILKPVAIALKDAELSLIEEEQMNR